MTSLSFTSTPPAPRHPRRFFTALFAALCLLLPLSGWSASLITTGTRYPSNEEQYTLQLINKARTSADGLTILRGFVSNDLSTITASSTGTSGTGTNWSTGFWKSNIPGVAESMNYFKVHPGDLKKQFQDLGIPGTPLAWHPNLGNVAAGYNDIVIASQGVGSGFPHSLSPYSDQSTFASYAKRYTDGGYGPLNTINALGENIAPNFNSSALMTFAAFMIDWGNTANGIQSQDPNYGSHRISLMGSDYVEIGISRKSGWSSGATTEVQEFGRKFAAVPAIVGALFTDSDSNSFYTPGEGIANATVTAAPVGGGTSVQTTTFSSGGYVLPISAPGDYTVTFTTAAGVVATANVTVGNESVALNAIASTVVVPPVDPPTDPVDPPTPNPTNQVPTDLNGDSYPDYVLFNSTTRRTTLWYLNNATKTGQADGPILNSGWTVAAVADFNQDGHPDYLLYNSSKRTTEVWYLDGVTKIGTAAGPTLTKSWVIVGAADFNADGKTDLCLYNSGTRATMIWYLDGVTLLAGTPAGPTLPSGAVIAGVGDFNADGKPDLLIFFTSRRNIGIYYLNGPTKTGETIGTKLFAKNWAAAGVADFDLDGRPDVLLYNSGTRQTEIHYMAGAVETGTAAAPVLTSGSTLVSP